MGARPSGIQGAVRTEKVLRGSVLRFRPQLFFGGELRIEFHRNTSTMASLGRRGRVYRLRLHELFARAPEPVLEALARCFFMRRGTRQMHEARERIFRFLERHRSNPLCHPCDVEARGPRGRVYDLARVQDALRRSFLPRCPRLRIGWSPRVTSTLMAKWVATPAGVPNVILVNPLLDSRRVPRYYLDYIVFHELLHEVIPIRRECGRWSHHPAEFRRQERRFPHFEKALRWERENVGILFDAHVRREAKRVANRS
jgi:hypothetical protein